MRLSVIVFILTLQALNGEAQQKDAADEKGAFVKLATYLANNHGVWITPNKSYDSLNKYSPVAIEMNFYWDEERQVLWDSVSLHFKKFTYLTWISTWSWHPGKKVLVYTSHGPEGRLISGETTIENEKTFTTLEMMYAPDGELKELKDENFIETDNVHRNVSYEKKQGKWEQTGSYTWTRKT